MIDRRSFLKISLISVTAFPLLTACSKPDPKLTSTLSHPSTLIQMCDSTTLHEIGSAYRQIRPEEDKFEILQKLLLSDSLGNDIKSTSDIQFIQEALQSQVAGDFQNGRIIKINGWIISITEARQCALFSLSQTSSPD